MSATRDKSQKTIFVYSNLYQLYRQGKEAAKQAEIHESLIDDQKSFFAIPSEKNVLKASDHKSPAAAVQAQPARKYEPKVEAYNPPELIGKRIVQRSETALNELRAPSHPASENAIQSLKQNLKTLNDLHARLRFMLQELEELVKE